MKCPICGYDDHGTGDTAHVCKPAFNPLGGEMRAYKHAQQRTPAAPVVAEGFPRLWAVLRLSDKVIVQTSSKEGWLAEVYGDAGKYAIAEVAPLADHPVAGSTAEVLTEAQMAYVLQCRGMRNMAQRAYALGRAAAEPMPASEAAKSIRYDRNIYAMLTDYRTADSVGANRLNALYDHIDAYFAAPAAPTDAKAVSSIAPRRPHGTLAPEADEFVRLMTVWRFADVGEKSEQAFNAVVKYIDDAQSVRDALEIDYDALIVAAEKLGHRQGTRRCVAFKHGAEWFRALIQSPQPTGEQK